MRGERGVDRRLMGVERGRVDTYVYEEKVDRRLMSVDTYVDNLLIGRVDRMC